MIGRLLVPVRLAFRAIRRNAMRAALTVLGILIGVASVVTVASLGTGARDMVSKQLESIGSNMIFVSPQSKVASGLRSKTGMGRITEDDAHAIQREAVSIAMVSPVISALVPATNGDRTHTAQLQGVTPMWFTVHKWDLARGAVWSEHDDALKAKVCILGQTARDRLFGTEDPVGHVIRLGRYPCRVVGLLTPKGDLFGRDQDDQILMPLGGVRARYARTPPGTVHYLELSATSPETTDRAVSQVTSILRQRHRIREGTEPDFRIQTQKAILEVQGQIFGVLTMLLTAAAAISLLVGGIGIMNIMLVSVAERTREIGIRMAIGAREGDIRMQFLVEAIVLSMLGGACGAVLGGAVVSGAGKALGWSMSVSAMSLGVALLVSAAIGITFGFFPARRASKLDPIEALRHE
jgi:putative ABC transport system permease protein